MYRISNNAKKLFLCPNTMFMLDNKYLYKRTEVPSFLLVQKCDLTRLEKRTVLDTRSILLRKVRGYGMIWVYSLNLYLLRLNFSNWIVGFDKWVRCLAFVITHPNISCNRIKIFNQWYRTGTEETTEEGTKFSLGCLCQHLRCLSTGGQDALGKDQGSSGLSRNMGQ
jgi:hypothetical protein